MYVYLVPQVLSVCIEQNLYAILHTLKGCCFVYHVSQTTNIVCPRQAHALFQKMLAGDMLHAMHEKFCQGFYKSKY